jgi:hypothetical protein
MAMSLLGSLFVIHLWALTIFGGLIYWMPTIVALARQSSSRGAIAALNLFFGWTVLGWIVALVWSIGSTTGYPRLHRQTAFTNDSGGLG